MNRADALLEAARDLIKELEGLAFSAPTTHVYNPLTYAWRPHEQYLRRFAQTPKEILFLGMNPGPFGMAQTGVPFGEVAAVRDWMQITDSVDRPLNEHPKRRIEGFACTRSEVSGQRLWGLFSLRFPEAKDFFASHFVANFCPLVFMEETGRNRTPDKLPRSEIEAVYAACLRHLTRTIEVLEPSWVIGVGAFAENQGKQALASLPDAKTQVSRILHPSPASPAANRGWAEQAERQLKALGIW